MGKVSPEVRKRYQDKTYRKYTIRLRYDGGDGITPAMIEDGAAAAGTSVNDYVVLRLRQGSAQASDLAAALSLAGIDAKTPADAQRETVEQYVKRAVETQAQRDDLRRRM